jgi:predicted lysophospholipase L1 biosynthesis ABC-type transport system permease subunit
VEGLEENASSEAFTGAAIGAAPGADVDALVGTLEAVFEASPQSPPVAVQNLEQLGRLPEGVAAMVGSVAVLAIANALVVAVRRRGRDLAVLRAIGFTRRQTGSTVVVMALAIVILGAVVGVPIGVAIGSTLWQMTADGAFVLSDPNVRLLDVVAPVLGAVVVGLVAAAVPATRAAGRRASVGLRAE